MVGLGGGEPCRAGRRLISVRRLVSSLGSFALVLGAALAWSPASARLAASQVEGLLLEAEAGIKGYVPLDKPSSVTVRITSPQLVTGVLEVRVGSSTVTSDVEVPAGGDKLYSLAIPPQQSTSLGVRLQSGETTVAEQTLRIRRPPSDRLLVGVFGSEATEDRITGTRTVPLDREVEVLAVTADQLPAIGVLPYLVVDAGSLSSLSTPARDRLFEWVRGGGRLIGPQAELAELTAGSELASLAPAALVARVGRGEVLVIDSSTADFSTLLRDIPPARIGTNPGGSPFGDSPLVGAASVTQQLKIPQLPWLITGVIAFVLLVGPVNFLVLRWLHRPALAWITVPVLAAGFLLAFWQLGISSRTTWSVNQASLLVSGEKTAHANGALVLVAGKAGDYQLQLPPQGTGYVVDALDPFNQFPDRSLKGKVSSSADSTEVVFDLEDLGAGAVQAVWTDAPVDMTISLDQSKFTVTNQSQHSFWAWGMVGDGGRAVAANQPLEVGVSGDVILPSGRFSMTGSITQAVITVIGDDYDEETGLSTSNRIDPFNYALQAELGSGFYDQTFFFGFTESYVPGLRVNGQTGSVTGTTLVVVPVELSSTELAARGFALPSILAVDGAASVEQYPGDPTIYAYGADAFYLRYLLPAGDLGQLVVNPASSRLDVVEVFDWERKQFVRTSWPLRIGTAAHVSGGGELIVRASTSDNRQDQDPSFRVLDYEIEWGTA